MRIIERENMNRSSIYEQIAEQMLQQPLSVFRTKLKAIQFVKEIIKTYESEKLKRIMMEKPL